MRTLGDGTDVLHWVLSDHLGSTSTTANADGTLHSVIQYTAFGEIRSTQGNTPTKYRYTSQLAQAEPGLDYYVARFYDPLTGHFTQADSIIPGPGKASAFDRYAYVQNNPLNRNDPTGHFAPLVAAGVGALVGFSIDILVQGVPQLAAGNYFNIQINWAEAAGATTAGAIAGGTFGMGTVVIGGYTLEGAKAFIVGGLFGSMGNIAGNISGGIVESSIETGNELLSDENILFASQNKGVFDPCNIGFDAATGFLSGGINASFIQKPVAPSLIGPEYQFGGYKYTSSSLTNKLGNPVNKPNYQIPLPKDVISYKSFTSASDYIHEAAQKWAKREYENNIRRLKKNK